MNIFEACIIDFHKQWVQFWLVLIQGRRAKQRTECALPSLDGLRRVTLWLRTHAMKYKQLHFSHSKTFKSVKHST